MSGPRSIPRDRYMGVGILGGSYPGGTYLVGRYPRGVGIQGEVGIQGGRYTYPLQILTPPLVLTTSGNHQNRYDWLVGGTHPTGMLSCLD